MKESIIIIEGAQGVGKTTATDYLRNVIPYTNLYRLNGNRDKTPTGYQKALNMYQNLLRYMKTLEHDNLNLLFDRTFFSEEAYARLGYKEYSFTSAYEALLDELSRLDFDIYFIVLYLEDVSLFAKRLERSEKTQTCYTEFDIQNSINQQNTYLTIADEVSAKYPHIKVIKVKNDTIDTSRNIFNDTFKEIMKK